MVKEKKNKKRVKSLDYRSYITPSLKTKLEVDAIKSERRLKSDYSCRCTSKTAHHHIPMVDAISNDTLKLNGHVWQFGCGHYFNTDYYFDGLKKCLACSHVGRPFYHKLSCPIVKRIELLKLYDNKSSSDEEDDLVDDRFDDTSSEEEEDEEDKINSQTSNKNKKIIDQIIIDCDSDQDSSDWALDQPGQSDADNEEESEKGTEIEIK